MSKDCPPAEDSLLRLVDALATRVMSRTSQKVCQDDSLPVPIVADLAADIISTVEFDQTGDYLASGDKGGRVVLFERNHSVSFVPSSSKSATLTSLIEERLRVQILHRVSVPRA